MEKLFRELRADEIEVRVGREMNNGYVELLLYKTSRTDMNLLDEVYGATNWQCDYKEVNGVVYCGIGIKSQVNGEWCWKWNAGGESNFEKEKGQASDAFKRAGFCWGIGRELYTAPKIVVKAEKYETFTIEEIKYEDGKIVGLRILNKNGDVVYNYPGGCNTASYKLHNPVEKKSNAEMLKDFCSNEKNNPDIDKKVLKKFYEFYNEKIDSYSHITAASFEKMWNKWQENERRAS